MSLQASIHKGFNSSDRSMAICGLYANDQRETEQGAALIADIGTDNETFSSTPDIHC